MNNRMHQQPDEPMDPSPQDLHSADSSSEPRTILADGTAYTRNLDDLAAIAVLVVLLLLLAVFSLLWLTWDGSMRLATPTLTATSAASSTATPDVRATRNQQDLMTQVAMQTHAVQTPTPTTAEPMGTTGSDTLLFPVIPSSPLTSTTTIVAPTSETDEAATMVPQAATETPTPTGVSGAVSIRLPYAASQPSSTPTETPTPSLTPTETPTVFSPIELPTATETPTFTPTPELILPTATETPTVTPFVTPSPTPFTVAELIAFVLSRPDGSTLPLRRGPSSTYDTIQQMVPGKQLAVRGRDATGEWIYVCCEADQAGWVRQASAPPVNNALPEGAPEGANANDVRWLRVEPPPAGLTPPPVSPSIPVGNYPLYRYDRTNGGNPQVIPTFPLEEHWSPQQRAQAAMISPVVLSEQGVSVGSDDGHLYSFSKDTGDQRWRYNLEGGRVSLPMAARSPYVYAVTGNSRVIAVQDAGFEAQLLWSQDLNNNTGSLTAITGINMLADTLYLGARSNSTGENYLAALDRNNGNPRYTIGPIAGSILYYPTVGQQLVYLGSEEVRAVDSWDGSTVWQRTDLLPVAAPMVYSSPGPSALAELYLVENTGVLRVLDANTGVTQWDFSSGETVTGLAVDSENVYLSGVSYVKAISRKDRVQRWRANVSDEVLGGPIVGPNYVLVVTRTGSLQFLQKTDGAASYSFVIGVEVIDAVAASGQYLFVPTRENTIRAYRGVQ